MSLTKIFDIAGAAGVSLATVSRVLNHPEKVKKETRDRVLKIIKERGYKPNANARSLASKRSTTIAVVVPTLTRASVSEVLQGVLNSANSFGYSLRIFSIDLKGKDLEENWLEIASFSVDGILILADEITKEFSIILEETPVPVVFLNTSAVTNKFGSVGVDEEKATYEATKFLIKNNRKKIIFLTSVSQEAINTSKEKGYLKAVSESNLKNLKCIVPGDVSLNKSELLKILSEIKPDGVVATRDSLAIHFMNLAIKNGFDVPENLEVIGLQDTRYAMLSRPALTCVKIPVYEIGKIAVENLTKQIRDEKNENEHIKLSFEIIERESTK